MRILLILISVSLIACNGTESTTAEGNFEGVPAAAIREPYPDNPKQVRITLKDNKGNITAEGDYYNGYRHGAWTEYHGNQLVSKITPYQFGTIEGLVIEIDNRGQLLSSENFHNGLKNGRSVTYNRNRIKEEKFYVDGNLDGIVKIYYDNGDIMEESPYTNGKRNGVAKWYDQEGNVSIEYKYENGERVVE